MMAMKIAVVAMTVVAFGHGIAAKRNPCLTRTDGRKFLEIKKEAKCGAPQQKIVPMPVPEGYDYVEPSVVEVKQCSELPCSPFPEKCLPRNSIPREIRVEAYQGVQKKCVIVTVFDHDHCECGCNRLNCLQDMVFKDETCRCECDPRLKKACDNRIAMKETVMWSENKCACVCNYDLDCGDPNASVFDRTVCRCVEMYE